MSSKEVFVKIRVFTDEMLKFFGDDASYGTSSKPYPADAFHTIEASEAYFTGPLRNIMNMEPDTTYHIVVETNKGVALRPLTEGQFVEMTLITEKVPSEKEWKKVIKNAPKPVKGKIKIQKSTKDRFTFETEKNLPYATHIKYNIVFEFTDPNGDTKYGIIDPYTETCPPPPPPPPNN